MVFIFINHSWRLLCACVIHEPIVFFVFLMTSNEMQSQKLQCQFIVVEDDETE